MKKLYLSLIITFLNFSVSYGQLLCNGSFPDEFDFDNSGTTHANYWLQIDTVSNPNNIWQIGSPQKTVINSAHSAPNVIITDTVHSYPPNDTSVFIIKHLVDYNVSVFAGYYNINTDSLRDYGTIEISPDDGTTWINLLTDVVYSSYIGWNGTKPTLTGNSNGWNYFEASIASVELAFNVHHGDTILFRLTFISDSIANNYEGLAYDNLMFCDYIEGINEMINDNLIAIYPNPTSDLLFIKRRTQQQKESVKIFNYAGQLLYENGDFKSNEIDIAKLNLTSGFYFMRYSNTSGNTMKKFIIQR